MYKRIRELRDDADKKQHEIAKYLGISQTGYSKYEVGTNDVPTAVLIALAKYYKVSTDYILGLTDNPIPPKRK